MSDRDKGLPAAIDRVFLEVAQSFCCQHIADNVQQCFSIKCQPLFWACAKARYVDEFEAALKALID
jgi:transposase-like protein